MRTARILTILSIVVILAALPAAAQRKRKPTPPKPTPIPVKLTVSPIVSVAKQQVSNQLYNVNIFVDKMGPIAVAIENADKQASARRLRKEDVDANEANKKKLIAAIRGLRDGLVALETDFKTKPQLAQYLTKIQGISSLCARAEDNAIAGRFVASKDPLRQIALKLNETLAVLPGPIAGDNRSGLNDRMAPAISGPMRTVSNPTQPASSQTRPVSNQTRPVSNQTQPASSQPRPISNQTAPVVNQPAANVPSVVSVGMTPSEVLASSWGNPSNKRVSTSPNGTTEVWLYSGNRTIYFFNGKVSMIVP